MIRWISVVTVAVFVTLMIVGIFPREAAFFVLGFLLFVILFLPLEEAFWIVIVTVPLSPALPLSGFDTLAVWRFVVIAIFLRWLWHTTRFRFGAIVLLGKVVGQSWAGRFFVGFFVWACITLFWAPDALFGLRQIVFLINIALLFPVAYWAMQRHRNLVFSAIITSIGLVVGIGYFQWILTSYFILAQFWVYWAQNIIPVFFGELLGNLLLVANTWFAYFPNDTATLRMFSLLPDSHSFGLFAVLGLSFLGSVALMAKSVKSRLGWFGVIVVLLMSIILSGTRGLWVAFPASFLGVFLLWLFGRRRADDKEVFKLRKGILIMTGVSVLFFALFPLSGLLLSVPSEGDGGDIDALRRARSSFDLSELSVKGRLEIWDATWRSFLQKPFHGVGYGNFGVILNKDAEFARLGASAHNLYFNIIAETGIVGGILMIGFLFSLLWRSIRGWLEGVFSVAVPAVLLWVLAYGLFDIVLLNDRVALLFVVVVALIFSSNSRYV